MNRNYELYEFNEYRSMNFAAKAANLTNSYPFVAKQQNFTRNDSYNS